VITEDFALPTGDEAERLLAGLARLITLRGVETFVAAPLLLAKPRYFPDKVEPRAQGVAVLLRRLLAYAGLEPKRVLIELYSSSRADPHVVHKDGKDQAAAWFMGLADGVYRFGVKETELRDEQALIGTLGHEVAHAYRTHHGLVVPTRETEEQLTDLTTIYLGFGVFTLESSYQFKTGHYSVEGQRLLYERQARGYLLPGQLAYLLAAQIVARGAREDLLEATLSSLSDNHRDAVKRAVLELRADEAGLLHSLALPAIGDWPAPRRLEDALAPLANTAVVIRDRAKSSRDATNQKIAFRIAGSRMIVGLFSGLALGTAMAIVAEMETLFWPWVLAFSAAGIWLGHQRKAPTCSSCGHTVALEGARCRYCAATLVGDIETKMDLFEAEERYRAAERQKLAEARRAATESATAKQRCPECQWIPLPSDTWTCTCGHRWNTFKTKGRCPDCDKLWDTTWCQKCKQPSPHAEWYG
jgi:hypothetical protein